MNEIRKEMRLLFLIFVIAWFHPSVYSAPFDVRIGRGLALRLHRRQVAYQGYPGYPEYTSTTSQQTFNQNVATQQTGVTSSRKYSLSFACLIRRNFDLLRNL